MVVIKSNRNQVLAGRTLQAGRRYDISDAEAGSVFAGPIAAGLVVVVEDRGADGTLGAGSEPVWIPSAAVDVPDEVVEAPVEFGDDEADEVE